MNKEIITTDNMDELVDILTESANNGNMTARLVHAVNQKINDLKVGKSLSKSDKEELMLLWDNLIVAFANDAASVGNTLTEYAKEYKVAYPKDSMYPMLISSSDIAHKVNEAPKNEESINLEELREALKGLTNDDIKACVDAFISELADDDDKQCCKCSAGQESDGKCNCECHEESDDGLTEDEVVKAIMDILEDEDEYYKAKDNESKAKVIIVKTGGRPAAYDEFDSIFNTMFRRFFH
jgi:hypothetical protein